MGSFIAAVQLSIANGRTKKQLFYSYVSEARAHRWSQRPGKRFAALKAISGAVQLLESVPHDPADRLDLRNQVIASLAMADAQLLTSFELGMNHQAGLDSRLELVAESNATGQITIRRIDDGTELQVLPPLGVPAYRILFSSDDRYLAAAYSDPNNTRKATARVWDLSNGKTIVEDEVRGWSFVFSPDSTKVAFGREDGRVTVFDIVRRSRLCQLQTDLPRVGIVFRADSKILATYSPNRSGVRLYELPESVARDVLPPREPVLNLAWSSDGSFLAAFCRNRCTYVWNVQRNANHATLRGHQGLLNAACFSPVGDQLATCSEDGKLILWDVVGGDEKLRLDATVFCRFGGDGRRIATRNYHTVSIYEIASGLEFRELAGHKGNIWCVGIAADGRLLVSAGTDGVRLWDALAMREIQHLPVGESRSVLIAPKTAAVITVGDSRLAALARSPNRKRRASWPARVVGDVVRPSQIL